MLTSPNDPFPIRSNLVKSSSGSIWELWKTKKNNTFISVVQVYKKKKKHNRNAGVDGGKAFNYQKIKKM